MERSNFKREQIISKSGEPGIRYRIEERIDQEHKIVLVAVPFKDGLTSDLLGWESEEAKAKWQANQQANDLSSSPLQEGINNPLVTGVVSESDLSNEPTSSLDTSDTMTEQPTPKSGLPEAGTGFDNDMNSSKISK